MAEHWGIKDVYCLPVENNAALLTLVSSRSKSIVIEMIAKVHQCLHFSTREPKGRVSPAHHQQVLLSLNRAPQTCTMGFSER